MVEKLYYIDPYQTECYAKVLSIEDDKVRLDKTIFYAFSGGQASDSGKIGGFSVKEAIAEGDDVVYVLKQIPDFSVGDRVLIEIDKEKRLRIMRLHSAAHLLYHFFTKKTGIEKTIGSNTYEDKSRLDFESDKPVSDIIPGLQKECDEMIRKDLEIKTYDDPDKPGRRIWECGEIKYPCGGIHVRSTGEIGRIKLKRKNIGAGKERIEILLQD